MCFSAESSFVSSAILTIGGIATIRQVTDKSHLPFAFFPLIFAFHQFVEGWIWWAQTHATAPWVEPLSARIFPLIAYSVWSTLVPYSIHRMETHPTRKIMLRVCMAVGVLVSLFFGFYIVTGPVTIEIINHSIHYDFYFSFFALSQWGYGFAIILAALVSSHKIINLFGLGLVITYNIAKIFYEPTYPSVFCYLAALLSLIIYLHIRYGKYLKQWHARPVQSTLEGSETQT